MVRKYTKKSSKLSWSDGQMQLAIDQVNNGQSIAGSARDFGVPRSTLHSKIEELKKGSITEGSFKKDTGGFKKTFTDEQELALCQYIINMDTQSMGLSSKNIRRLAFDFATKLKIKHNFNNKTNLAGEDWLQSFMRRHNLSSRKAEHTSKARTLGFDEKNMSDYFSILQGFTSPEVKKYYDLIQDIQCLTASSLTESNDGLSNSKSAAHKLGEISIPLNYIIQAKPLINVLSSSLASIFNTEFTPLVLSSSSFDKPIGGNSMSSCISSTASNKIAADAVNFSECLTDTVQNNEFEKSNLKSSVCELGEILIPLDHIIQAKPLIDLLSSSLASIIDTESISSVLSRTFFDKPIGANTISNDISSIETNEIALASTDAVNFSECSSHTVQNQDLSNSKSSACELGEILIPLDHIIQAKPLIDFLSSSLASIFDTESISSVLSSSSFDKPIGANTMSSDISSTGIEKTALASKNSRTEKTALTAQKMKNINKEPIKSTEKVDIFSDITNKCITPLPQNVRKRKDPAQPETSCKRNAGDSNYHLLHEIIVPHALQSQDNLVYQLHGAEFIVQPLEN